MAEIVVPTVADVKSEIGRVSFLLAGDLTNASRALFVSIPTLLRMIDSRMIDFSIRRRILRTVCVESHAFNPIYYGTSTIALWRPQRVSSASQGASLGVIVIYA